MADLTTRYGVILKPRGQPLGTGLCHMIILLIKERPLLRNRTKFTEEFKRNKILTMLLRICIDCKSYMYLLYKRIHCILALLILNSCNAMLNSKPRPPLPHYPTFSLYKPTCKASYQLPF